MKKVGIIGVSSICIALALCSCSGGKTRGKNYNPRTTPLDEMPIEEVEDVNADLIKAEENIGTERPIDDNLNDFADYEFEEGYEELFLDNPVENANTNSESDSAEETQKTAKVLCEDNEYFKIESIEVTETRLTYRFTDVNDRYTYEMVDIDGVVITEDSNKVIIEGSDLFSKTYKVNVNLEGSTLHTYDIIVG